MTANITYINKLTTKINEEIGGGGEGEEHTETNIKSQYILATKIDVLYTGGGGGGRRTHKNKY